MKRTNNNSSRNTWRTKEKFYSECLCNQDKCFSKWIKFLDEWYQDKEDCGDLDYMPSHCYYCHDIFIEGKDGANCTDCGVAICGICTSDDKIGNYDSDDEYTCADCKPEWCDQKRKEEHLEKETREQVRVISFNIATTGLNPFDGDRIIDIAVTSVDFCMHSLKVKSTRKYTFTETRSDLVQTNFDYNQGWWASDAGKKETIAWLQTKNSKSPDIKANIRSMMKGFFDFLKKETAPEKSFFGQIFVTTIDPGFSIPFINQLSTTDKLPVLKIKGITKWLEIIDLISFRKGQLFKKSKFITKFDVHPTYVNKPKSHLYAAETKADATAHEFIVNFNE
jgi:hypothetical protein